MANGRSVVEDGLLELSLTRRVSAPLEVVFSAWTDAKQLAEWWGPKGFTNPRCEVDARVGGAIHIDMRAPDGMVYPLTGRILEIDPPHRLVFETAALDGDGKPMFEVLNTVTFAAVRNSPFQKRRHHHPPPHLRRKSRSRLPDRRRRPRHDPKLRRARQNCR